MTLTICRVTRRVRLPVAVTATGGLTESFSHLTVSRPGWQLRTNATSIIATYVGVPAARP